MKCPRCDNRESRVLESRTSHEGHSVRRRRSCLRCSHRFTTYEKEEELTFQIRKKDNRFEDFSRAKLIRAISTACRKRPIPIDQIENIVISIEFRIRSEGERVVPSSKVGDMVMERLRETDHVAYVRFASIYKDFQDKEEFIMELQDLEKEKSGDNHVYRPD